MAAELDLVVEDAATGFCGAVVGYEKSYAGDLVRLEDRQGQTRVFLMLPAAFLIDGKPVTLVKAQGSARRVRAGVHGRRAGAHRVRSRAVPKQRARTARASRIFVEGVHDATLLERVWGDDLRVEGVVVRKVSTVSTTSTTPSPTSSPVRIGVPEFSSITSSPAPGGPAHRIRRRERAGVRAPLHRRVAGRETGIRANPGVADDPRGTDWKTGICRELGWGHHRTAGAGCWPG